MGFTDPKIFGEEEAASWWESSDTVRSAGMSKAVFSLQRSVRFQRAVLFAMINPQPNGAGFAGVKSNISFSEEDLKTKPQGFLLKLRGQGQLKYWKVVLTDSDKVGLPLIYTYEHKFPLNSLDNRETEEVHLPLTSLPPSSEDSRLRTPHPSISPRLELLASRPLAEFTTILSSLGLELLRLTPFPYTDPLFSVSTIHLANMKYIYSNIQKK